LTLIIHGSIFANDSTIHAAIDLDAYPNQSPRISRRFTMSPIVHTILEYFNQINAIPRCSNHEAQLAEWLKQWAAAHRFDTREDPAGNLVMAVPPSPGYESAPGVVLQGHMDMVCEKTPDASHDFTTDPIRSKVEGDWLMAEGTTLGADNGIAIAYALALAEDEQTRHPPLEFLFTVDEESGLNGAKKLGPHMLASKLMINLDSEDEGIFTIGCAGGADIEMQLKMAAQAPPSDWIPMQVRIGGFMGGHSGIDIHKGRGNANKILARMLTRLQETAHIRLVSIAGGSRHNAIARDAHALVACAPLHKKTVQKAVSDMQKTILQEYSGIETAPFVTATDADCHADAALSPDDTDRVIRILTAMPHGVCAMSHTFANTVETSSNLATVALDSGKLTILSSQRSALVSRLEALNHTIYAVAGLAGAETRTTNGYPPWTPKRDSRLLTAAQRIYRRLFDKDPIVQVIHAGLECAIIGDRYENMDMISFGPTIRNPHSPSERLYIPSIEKVWNLLVTLLQSLNGSR
jgi:dipeptidase D